MTLDNNLTTETKKELLQHTLDQLQEVQSDSVYGCDLHNLLFNSGYYLIGYYQCEQWLINSGGGIFNAIETIKEYENDNFGEVNTDFSSSEKVLNMYIYILGEEILSNYYTILDKDWDNLMSLETLNELREAIQTDLNDL